MTRYYELYELDKTIESETHLKFNDFFQSTHKSW